MRTILRIYWAFLFICAASLPPANAAPSPWGEKPFGVLLVTAVGGRDWNKTVNDARKSLGKLKPVESVSGVFGTREIQRALKRLEAQKVKKIVVVPLSLTSESKEIEQLEYLLGIRELPSKKFLSAWRMKGRIIKRAKAKVPIVMSGSLDDHPLVVGILSSRAGEMSIKPEKEAVVLVGFGSAYDEENTLKERLLEKLAKAIQVEGKYKIAKPVLMRPSTKEKPRLAADSEKRLRNLIRLHSVTTRVIVVPHLLIADGRERYLRKNLDRMFHRFKGKALLPDDRIAQWITMTAEKTSSREDMVKFKDKGKKLPPEPRKRNVK